MKVLKLSWLVVVAVLAHGCATSRSVISVDQPSAGSNYHGESGSVNIRVVTDNRQFEEAPKTPSIPSLGLEGSAAASQEIKRRAIGRKRNSYGQALGDVLLPEGQSVEELIKLNTTSAFQDSGWKVITDPQADRTVEIVIEEFWAWVRPGFWAITVNANIKTGLNFTQESDKLAVEIHVEQPKSFVGDQAWKEIIELALKNYRKELLLKLGTLK